MRFFAQTATIVLLSATLILASLAASSRARAQTPPPSPEQQPTPTQTPTPTPPASDEAADVDDEVETVETNLVNVIFNAVDRNRRFVTTLRQEDVRIFENNEQQTISLFQRETNLPLSIGILVDVSGSQISTLPYEKKAALQFLTSILRPEKDEAAVVSFTGEAILDQDLTKNHESLRRAIEGLEIILPPKPRPRSDDEAEGTGTTVIQLERDSPVGWSSVWDAIWATSNEVMANTSPQTRRAIILLSDGDDTYSRLKREDAVDAAVKANTVVYSIGVEPDCSGTDMDCRLDRKALRKVSEATGGQAFFPEDEAQLNFAFAQIQQELRAQYLVAYSPTNRARDNTFRQLKIDLVNPELRKQKLKLTYRNGYFARPPAPARNRAEQPAKSKLTRPTRSQRKR
jgi:VWFA-related protein